MTEEARLMGDLGLRELYEDGGQLGTSQRPVRALTTGFGGVLLVAAARSTREQCWGQRPASGGGGRGSYKVSPTVEVLQ